LQQEPVFHCVLCHYGQLAPDGLGDPDAPDVLNAQDEPDGLNEPGDSGEMDESLNVLCVPRVLHVQNVKGVKDAPQEVLQ